MLAILGGNENPSADDIRMIIESVGVEVEENKLSILMDKLKGKNLTQIQEEGKTRENTFSRDLTIPHHKYNVRAKVLPVSDNGENKADCACSIR